VPPEGRRQPIRGFGKVWREQLGGPEAPIGWATASESGGTLLIQPFVRGTLLRGFGADVYVLWDDGTWTLLNPDIGRTYGNHPGAKTWLTWVRPGDII
jgi:hypothetical protein